MRDCTSCPFSPETHPEYALKQWEELECSRCKPMEPFGRNEQFQDMLKWDVEPLTKRECRGYKFIYFMSIWMKLSHVQRQFAGEKLVNPEIGLTTIADKYGVTRQNVKASFERICKQFPGMEELLK